MKINLNYFTVNEKTQFSYEFGICRFMKRNENYVPTKSDIFKKNEKALKGFKQQLKVFKKDKSVSTLRIKNLTNKINDLKKFFEDVKNKYYATCGVNSCYSCNNLGFKPSLENKILEIENRFQHIDEEISYLNFLNTASPVTVRGFSFTEFSLKHKFVFFHILSNLKVANHLVISKNLWVEALKGNVTREELEFITENCTLSLGFTKRLYKPFKKFLAKFGDLKFSVCYTSNSKDDIEWLNDIDHELAEKVDVYHDHLIHYNKGKFDGEKSPSHIKEYVSAIDSISSTASNRLCNMYGGTSIVKKGCTTCSGCSAINRFRK